MSTLAPDTPLARAIAEMEWLAGEDAAKRLATPTAGVGLLAALADYATHKPDCASLQNVHPCGASRGILGMCPRRATYCCIASTKRSSRMVHYRCYDHRNGYTCDPLPLLQACSCGLAALLNEVRG